MPSVAHDGAPTRPAPAGTANRTRWLWLRALAGAAAALAASLALLLLAAPLALTALLPAYLAAEALFAAHFFARRARLSALPGPEVAPNEPEGHDGDAAFERFMAIAPDVRKSTGIDGLLRCWYGADTPFSEIRRGNAAELLVYGFHYRSVAQVAAAGRPDAGEQMLCRLERAWDFSFQPGYNPSIRLMTHLWEPIKAHWRPLAFYGVMEAFALAKHWAMLAAGWRCERAPGGGGGHYYTYGLRASTEAARRGAALHDAAARGASAEGRRRWSALLTGARGGNASAFGGAGSALRRRNGAAAAAPPLSRAPSCDAADAPSSSSLAADARRAQDAQDERAQVPILFCHGVGLGLAPYVPLVQRLAATGRPVIALEFKHLAMRWTRRVPTVEEVADSLVALLGALGAARCDAVGHSFGTFYLSRLLRARPDLVRTAALLDPVCCCMWTGDLISNFVYRPERSRTGLTTWLIARDLHTAASVSRRFFWTEFNAWPDVLPARTLLAVGERDDLVPIAHVAATVAADAHSGGRVTLVSHPQRAHADVVFDPAWQARVLDEALAQMACADEDDAANAAAAAGAAGGLAAVAGRLREAQREPLRLVGVVLPEGVRADVLELGGGREQQQQPRRTATPPRQAAQAGRAAPPPLSPPSPPSPPASQDREEALRRLRPRAPRALSIGSPASPRTPPVDSGGAQLPSPPPLLPHAASGPSGGALAAFAAAAAAAPRDPPTRSASAAAALRGSGTSTTSAWAAAAYGAGLGGAAAPGGGGAAGGAAVAAPPSHAPSLTRQASLASAAGEALAPSDQVVAELRGFGCGGSFASKSGSGGVPSSLVSLSSGGSDGASEGGAEDGGGGGSAPRTAGKGGKRPLLFGGGEGASPPPPAAALPQPGDVKHALSSLLARQRLQQQQQQPQQQHPSSP